MYHAVLKRKLRHVFAGAYALGGKRSSLAVYRKFGPPGQTVPFHRPSLFITLEDGTSMIEGSSTPNFLCQPRHHHGSTELIVTGVLQREKSQVSIRTKIIERLAAAEAAASHDFR